MTSDLEFVAVAKRFGAVEAVRRLDLTVREGEFFSFLGPSGCGKTTILRMVSGFIEPTSGDIRLGDRSLKGIAPHKRPTALIFQSLALFPLMTVAENIAFGLTVRGVAAAECRHRVAAMLDFVALPGFEDRRIDELSGGQMQRVAIGRALAVEPKVLLLDEPLSALDLKLRQHMRAELRAIQKRTGVTFIYITHDQGEALAMSDRVAVMSQGVVEQVGDSAEIYDHPASAFVASFVGENNVVRGRVARVDAAHAEIATAAGSLRGRNPRGVAEGAEAMLFVRPERLRLGPRPAVPVNTIDAEATGGVFEGSSVAVALRSAGGHALTVALSNDGALPDVAPGARHAIWFPPDDAVVLPMGPLARD